MVVDIEPHVRARVEQLVARVGEAEFRRGVAQMTRWDTEIRSLDDVICLYVSGALLRRWRFVELGEDCSGEEVEKGLRPRFRLLIGS